MSIFLFHVGALVGLFCLTVQCEANGERVSVADLQKTLELSLGKVEPDYKREVEAYLAAVEQTAAIPDGYDERLKQAAIVYRDSKGAEATKTELQRVQLFDALEAACRDVRRNLEQFSNMDKAPWVEVDKSSDIAKWRLARKACDRFIQTCTHSALVRESQERWTSISPPYTLEDNYNELRGIGKFAPKKKSRLGKLLHCIN